MPVFPRRSPNSSEVPLSPDEEARPVVPPEVPPAVAPPSRRSKPLRNTPTRIKRRRWWLRLFLLGLAMMIIGSATGVGFFLSYVHSLPPIDKLEVYDPDEISRVFDRTGQQTIGEFKQIRRQVVPLDQIPRRLQNAFLAVEDSRFYNHYGVDVIGVARALMVDIKTRSMKQGASTITAQLTRNILPDRVGFSRLLGRKVIEAFVAMQIERRYSKKQILEFYLNTIDFGKNAAGVKAAAATYFSKDLDDLTISECAVLAGIIKGPTAYNPVKNPKMAKQRRDIVLGRMRKLDMITEVEYQRARAEPIQVRRSFGAVNRYPYFVKALQSDLNRYYSLSETELGTAGLRITATVDRPIQEICDKALAEGLFNVEQKWQKAKRRRQVEENKGWDGVLREGMTRLMEITDLTDKALRVRLLDYTATIPYPEKPDMLFWEPDKILKEGQLVDVTVTDMQGGGKFAGKLYDTKPVQGSIVVLDAHTGQVLALTGGTDMTNPVVGWNRALQGGRQVGSTFKPFVYAAAFARGFLPSDVIYDEPVEYMTANKPYRPRNYEKNFVGGLTLAQALTHSRNVVTLRLFEGLGVKKTIDFVHHFDFIEDQPQWKIPPEISSCLGTGDSSPFEMASAYQVFANQGVGVRPQFFISAADNNGRLEIPIRRREQVILDPVANYQTLYVMRQVVLQGTGKTEIGDRFPNPPFPQICGKTGTTTNCVDAWFCGVTPDLVLIVQVGFDQPYPMGPGMTGGVVAGPIWANAFDQIFKSRENWKLNFEAPEGLEYVSICGETGKRVGDLCSSLEHPIFPKAPFRAGTAPQGTCDGSPSRILIAPVGPGEGESYLASRAPLHGYASRAEVVETEPADTASVE